MAVVQPIYQTINETATNFITPPAATLSPSTTGEYGIAIGMTGGNVVGTLFVAAKVAITGYVTGIEAYYYNSLGTKVTLGSANSSLVPATPFAGNFKMSVVLSSTSQIIVLIEYFDYSGAVATVGLPLANNSFVINFPTTFQLNTSGTRWGVYSQPYVAANGTMLSYPPTISELYAAKYNSSQLSSAAKSSKKHFETQNFAENIVRNIPNSTPHYFWQTYPIAKGVKIYDVKHELAPAIFNFANKLQIPTYDQGTASGVATGTTNTLNPANAGDIGNSGIFFTPFRSRFMVYHNSKDKNKGLLWLCPPANTNSNIAPLALLSKFAYPSAEKTITKIIDSNYTNNTIQIQTDWIKDDGQINKILENLVKGASSFHSEFQIRIFGNPLVQVGDFAQITYSLKRMGYDPDDATVKPIICLVKAVSQSFDGGLQETALTLKPMIAS
jgi:hypothetical protein